MTLDFTSGIPPSLWVAKKAAKRKAVKPKPLTAPQLAFCEAYALSRNGTGAYTVAYPQSSPAAARSSAPVLLANPRITAEIERIRAKAGKAGEMSRVDAVKMCVDILNSPPSKASMDNPLCELKMSKMGPFAAFPDKSATMARLSKMLGWDEPEKHQLEVNVVIGGNADDNAND